MPPFFSPSAPPTVESFSAILTEELRRLAVPCYALKIFLAYSLHKAKTVSKGSLPAFPELLNAIDSNDFVKETIEKNIEDIWKNLEFSFSSYDCEIIKSFILSCEPGKADTGFSRTPPSLLRLASALLEITETDSVADLGMGAGNFLANIIQDKKTAKLYAIESLDEAATVAMIKAELLGGDIEVERGDMFSIFAPAVPHKPGSSPIHDEKTRKFTKVFANYPLKMAGFSLEQDCQARAFLAAKNDQLHIWQKESELYQGEAFWHPKEVPEFRSSDWLFNLLLLESLENEGKAVAIMTSGACQNSSDAKIREYFVEGGYIETIISLPRGLSRDNPIAIEMIVLSKRCNQAIRMIDASKLYAKGRRHIELSAEHLREIIAALSTDSECSQLVHAEEIADQSYLLTPAKFLKKPRDLAGCVRLGDVSKKIARGVYLSAEKLDGLISDKPTKYQLLRVGDIENGIIKNEPLYLVHMEARLARYTVREGDLLLSKNGVPFKTAVVENLGEKTIIVSDNMFIITLDTNQISARFLQAFLESEQGSRLLRGISVGTTMTVIQVAALKEMLIPCPPRPEQKEIEERYARDIEEIRDLQSKLDKAIRVSKSYFKAASENHQE